MSKRKSPVNRVLDFGLKCRQETMRIMKERGIDSLNLLRENVNVFVAVSDKGDYKIRPVTRVYIYNDSLGIEYPSENWWYHNPIIWVEVLEAVYRKLGIFDKTFKSE